MTISPLENDQFFDDEFVLTEEDLRSIEKKENEVATQLCSTDPSFDTIAWQWRDTSLSNMNAQLNKLLMENQQLSQQIHLLRREQLTKSGEVSILRQKCNNLEKQWAETKTLLSVRSEELLSRENEVARAKEEEIGRLKIELEFKEQELMATQANLRSLLRIDRNQPTISPSQPSQQIQSTKTQERPAVVQQKEVAKKFKQTQEPFICKWAFLREQVLKILETS